VRRHRELAFGALLAAAALAVLVGIGIAIWLVRPLRDLSVAMQAFSVGASPVFPRQSRIREVAYLTNEFIRPVRPSGGRSGGAGARRGDAGAPRGDCAVDQ